MLPVDILYHGDRANSALGVLVAFLLLFFATVTDFMKKADVFSKNGSIGDGEKRVLELWMTSQQTPVMKVTKEQVFDLAKAFATNELGWTEELDYFYYSYIDLYKKPRGRPCSGHV